MSSPNPRLFHLLRWPILLFSVLLHSTHSQVATLDRITDGIANEFQWAANSVNQWASTFVMTSSGRGLFLYAGVGSSGFRLLSKNRELAGVTTTIEPTTNFLTGVTADMKVWNAVVLKDENKAMIAEKGRRYMIFKLQENRGTYGMSSDKTQECVIDNGNCNCVCSSIEISHVVGGINLPSSTTIILLRSLLVSPTAAKGVQDFRKISHMRYDLTTYIATEHSAEIFTFHEPLNGELFPNSPYFMVFYKECNGEATVTTTNQPIETVTNCGLSRYKMEAYLVDGGSSSISYDLSSQLSPSYSAVSGIFDNLGGGKYYTLFSDVPNGYKAKIFTWIVTSDGPTVTPGLSYPPASNANTFTEGEIFMNTLLNVGPYQMLIRVSRPNQASTVTTSLHLISKITLETIGQYPVVPQISPGTFRGAEFDTDRVHFGFVEPSIATVKTFHSYYLTFDACKTTNQGLVKETADLLTRDIFPNLVSSCFDQTCTGDNCELKLVSVSSSGDQAVATFSENLASRLIGAVRISLLDNTTNPAREIQVSDSGYTLTINGPTLTIDLKLPNRPPVWTLQLVSDKPRRYPIKASDYKRSYHTQKLLISYPIDNSKGLSDTSNALGQISAILTITSSLVLISTNPSLAFFFNKVLSSFTYLSMLNGPFLILPSMILSNLLQASVVTGSVQLWINDQIGTEDCPLPVPIMSSGVNCNYLLNSGSDTVTLCIVFFVTLLVSILHYCYQRNKLLAQKKAEEEAKRSQG
jgi:hypothetical protein